ncbi:Retrovirus-related Pol polyprotein from transposon RE1 [Vitis vinifera]|uniref:Retrovirus-related Pol polyprotein from transposon RE1 n=1 Tax=Vitis vinifera TaxID=29760 RepID=A0A438IBE6_VITVI|nr:Retrovirus-related Pol polyprotein from transposon RE1 [Vitis vinifera]
MVWGFSFGSSFPSLFALTNDKEESVANVWDSLAEGGWGGWNPCFVRAFNDWEVEEASSFMERLHHSRVIEDVEDKVSWTETKSGKFSVKSLYLAIEAGGSARFPSSLIWSANVQPKISFFAWEATWGKALTLDKIQKRGWALANRCFLCLENEETIDHLLLHCSRTRVLWDLLFTILGVSWVLPCSVKETLLSWHGSFVGKKPISIRYRYHIPYTRQSTYPNGKTTILEEIQTLEKNKTWDITELHQANDQWVMSRMFSFDGDLEEEVYLGIPLDFHTPATTNKGTLQGEMSKLKRLLTKEFEIKDLGNLKYFLETRMLGCRPVDTLMDYTVTLKIKDNSTLVDKGQYQRLVGKLIYFSHARPEIDFLASVVSRFMNSPMEKHLEAVYRILRYLKMTPRKGLFFKKNLDRKIEVSLMLTRQVQEQIASLL